jgi:hypothetical protein
MRSADDSATTKTV